MPARRRRRVIQRRPDGPPTREELNEVYERLTAVERKARMGIGVSGVLSGEPDVDDSYLYEWEGNAATATEAENATTVGGFLPGEVPYITDGSAPGSSPTPTAQGGPRFFAVKWAAVSNPDLVTYEVHVSATSGFTPDATTLAGETPGLLAFLRKLPDGSDFAYDTDYFFKIVAKDEDGSAPESVESAAEQLDPNGADDLLAGSVTAEKFESVLNLSSSFLAGTFGGANVQVGFGVADDGAGNPTLDPSFIGVRAFDGTNADPVFKLPADGSPAQFRGVVKFGSVGSSKLLQNDMVQLLEQPGGSFATPLHVQTGYDTSTADSSLSAEFDSDPVVGNVIVAVVTHWDAGGAGANTLAGWTNLHNLNWGGSNNGRTQVFAKVATGSGDGAPGDPVIVSVDKSVDIWTIELLEFSGVTITENVTSLEDEDNSGGVMTLNTTASASKTVPCLLLGVGTCYGEFRSARSIDPNFPGFKTSSYPAGWTLGASIEADDRSFGLNGGNEIDTLTFYKAVAAADTSAFIIETNSDAGAGMAFIIALEAAANQVEPADANTARLYAADVAGNTYLHTTDEDGREQAVVLGAPGEVWRLELVTKSLDIASLAAHTGDEQNVTITGLAVGDYCFWLGTDTASRGMQYWTEPVCAVANTIVLNRFNADSAVVDPPSTNHYFLVIHRS